MNAKKVSLYLGLGLVGACCVTLSIAGLLTLFPLGGNSQTCARIEVNGCSQLSVAQTTLLMYYVENTCTTRLDYVKVVYGVYSVSGDLLDEEVDYIEDINPGESKGAARELPNPKGFNHSCNAVVVEEGK